MYSSFAFVFLTILISNLSWLAFAGDYPLIGVVLLQSAPRSDAFGTVTITQQVEGGPIVVEGIIFNLKPNSRFGLHVHEQGDITNACLSAGGHFNPYVKQHGSERSVERHWGDFGNILSDGIGNARIFITVQEGSLIGSDGYIGRALVLHAREDDLGLTDHEKSKTTGNSGDRIACGIIGIRQPIDRLPVPPQPQRNMNEPRPMSFVPTFRQQAPAVRLMK
jgi:Cu-Zn family superoxide dismutase